MVDKLYVVEKLTDDEKDYTIAHLVTDLDVAVALCSRDNKLSVSEWTYDKSLYRFNYTCSYDCNGNKVKEQWYVNSSYKYH